MLMLNIATSYGLGKAYHDKDKIHMATNDFQFGLHTFTKALGARRHFKALA